MTYSYPIPPDVYRPYGITPFLYRFGYTPIIAKFVPAIQLVGDDGSIVEPERKDIPYYLRIKNPTTRLPGMEQVLPATSIVHIPSNGIVKMQLVPSEVFIPSSYYTVEICQGRNVHVPIETMTWTVPIVPSVTKTTLIHDDNAGMDCILTQGAVFEILAIGHSGTWQLIDNQYIKWIDNPPDNGTQYEVIYRAAATLADLISQPEKTYRRWRP
jgi:hypothetical protein